MIEMPSGASILAVADGMGGGPRGDDASGLIVDLIASRAKALSSPENSRVQVLDAIEDASAQIRGWGVGSATTVLVVEIEAGSYRTYHVGDSEAVVTGQRGRIKWRTISHSPVGYATASGMLERGEAMVHEDRHLVESMVGLEGMHVDVGERRPFARRDTLAMGTDGLFDNLPESEIVDLVRSGPLPTAAAVLVDRVHEIMSSSDETGRGKPDDLAFILYRPGASTPGAP